MIPTYLPTYVLYDPFYLIRSLFNTHYSLHCNIYEMRRAVYQRCTYRYAPNCFRTVYVLGRTNISILLCAIYVNMYNNILLILYWILI